MAFVGTFFAAAGRLSVRFRWAIVLAWVAGAAAAMAAAAVAVERDAER